MSGTTKTRAREIMDRVATVLPPQELTQARVAESEAQRQRRLRQLARWRAQHNGTAS